MSRLFALAALAVAIVSTINLRPVGAEEPKTTKTVDLSSSVPDLGKLNAFEGVGLILGQKEWERLAAAWGIKDVPQVDFSKEMLLVGTWRGTAFKFLGKVKDGNLTVELVGDKNVEPGFRYKIISLKRDGIKKFQGKTLPKAVASNTEPLKKQKPSFSTGSNPDETLMSHVPPTGVIVSDKQWQILIKKWGIRNPPRVDFNRQFVVVGAARDSSFDLTPTVKNGNLILTPKGAKDTAPGFRWKIMVLDRDGIKTVNGKPLPEQ